MVSSKNISNDVEIEIDLPTDLVEWVEKTAEEKGISFSEVINQAVKEFVGFENSKKDD